MPNASPPALASGISASPPLRYALQAVHGAAVFDLGDRANGLAELQRARSEFGNHHTSPQQCASMATLEFRAALLLGHAADGAHRPGLADRPHRRPRGSPGHARLGRDRGGHLGLRAP